jgi:phosphoglycerol transferase
MYGRILSITRRVGVVAGYSLVYLLIWAALALLFAAAGIRYYWGEISVGQMMLNLVSVETDGGGGSIVWIGILVVGVAPVVLTAAIALWHALHVRRRRAGRSVPVHRSPWLARTVATVMVGTLVIGGTTAFARTVGVADYIKASNSEYDIADYYVHPTVTSDEDKRNLVLIYLESGEATLEDDQLFEKDAFAELKESTREADGWQAVKDFQQYEGGGWTMSGFVSTMCGVPLKATGSTDSSSGSSAPQDDDVDSYLGGITCLGDVLADHGYTNAFLGGANSSFAAKDTFLEGHGYSEVKGLRDWRIAGESEADFRSDWGLSDERLLENAKTEIDRLYAEAEETGQPFNLSLLTLDTHEPVHVYDYCAVDTEHEVTSVYSCSMTLVAGFVDYMEQQGYLEDTAVVIMGDHLKHMNAGDSFHEQLDDHENRTIFNRIRVPGNDGATSLRSGIDQLSMYPTILEAAGLTLQDREAGVGVSAFASELPETSAPALDRAFYDDLIASLSPRFFEKAWAGGDLPE